MAAIEVKGGKVGVENGQWYQSDKVGRHPIRSPVAQSQGSQHAFKTWLEGRLGAKLSSRCAYLVSFPYTDGPRDWEVAGWPRSLILDQTDMKTPTDLIRHAIEHERLRRHHSGPGIPGTHPPPLQRGPHNPL